MVSEYVPAAVEDVVEMLNVQVPDVVIDEGLQLASMPAGIPLSASATAPVNPFEAAMLTEKLVLLPAATVCELGDAASEKSGGGLLVNVMPTVVLWLRLPLVPAIVSV